MTHDHRAALADLGLSLITTAPAGKYRGVSIVGDTGYVSGHIGLNPDGTPILTGVLGLFGMVHSAPAFGQHPAVIDGASELLLDVLGPEVATHSRSAVGMSSLPFNAAVELEMTTIIHA